MFTDPFFFPCLLASAAWALIYLIAFAAQDDTGLARSVIKTLPVLTLAAYGAIWSQTFAPSFAAIPIGLALGALGDWFLSRRGEGAFLTGMAAFALGHLAYVVGLWPFAATLSAGGAVALLGLIALILSTELWLAPRTGALRWPVRGYVVVIGLMGLAALRLGPDANTVKAGAALFILSDLLLALRLFVVTGGQAKRALSLALWTAYWAGQALILIGAMQLWPVLKP